MAVGAQVTSTTVEGESAYDLGDRGIGLKGPVSTCVSGVDLMAGAAILVSWVRIASFDLIEAHASSNTLAEDSTGVAECAALVAALFNEGNARTMQRLLP
jgi:hypothetical protein